MSDEQNKLAGTFCPLIKAECRQDCMWSVYNGNMDYKCQIEIIGEMLAKEEELSI